MNVNIEQKALRSMISGGGAIFIMLSVGYMLTFIYKILFARQLGPSDLGLFEMIITLLGLLTVIGGMGLYSGLTRFIPLYKNKKQLSYIKGYLFFIRLFQLFLSLFLMLFIFIFSSNITIFFGFPDIFTKLLLVLVVMIPFSIFSKSYEVLFFAHKRSLIAKIGIQLFQNLVMVAGAIYVIFLDLGVFAATLVILFSKIVMFLYYTCNVHKVAVKSKISKYDIKRWTFYALPLFFAGVIGFILNWTDNFVIAKFLTNSDLGIYSIAFSFAFYLFMAPKLFSGIFLPVMTELYEDERKSFAIVMNRLRSISFLFALLMGVVFLFFSKEILLLFFGDAYASGARSLQILSVFFILTSYFYYDEFILQLEEKTKYILYGDLLVLVINLTITILLVQTMGITGAAIGSGLSYFLIRYIFHIIGKKYIRVPHDYKYLLKSTFAIGISILVSYGIVKGVNMFFRTSLFMDAILAGLLYISFLIISIFIFKLIQEDDWVIMELIEKKTKLKLHWIKYYYYKYTSKF